MAIRFATASNGKRLCEGTEQNKRYYCILMMQAVRDNLESIYLGCDICNIGTHSSSNRKIAKSTSASKIGGPSCTPVCLRAGQTVGKTQNCYMFTEEDGDALLGRTVAQ